MRLLKKLVYLEMLLILLVCTAEGRADTSFVMAFECPSAAGNVQVLSRKVEDNYQVFLPGCWDLRNIRISFENADSVSFDKKTMKSGETVDLSAMPGKKLKLTRNGKKKLGSITIYHGSTLANVHLTLDGKSLKKALKDKHLIIPEGHALITAPDGKVEYDGELTQFKGRGNNTYSNKYAKKPFQFKLASKADLCGMGKGKTWLLIANYLDISLMRNQINLDLARETGMRGAIECTQADVWLNGVYQGLYLLTEKIQINRNRLPLRNLEEETEALNELPADSYKTFSEKDQDTGIEIRGYEIPNDPEDITGGYILELDKPYRYDKGAESGFKTSVGLHFIVKEPTCISRRQADYISGLFDCFWRGVQADSGYDPVTGTYYADFIDMESFAIKFLLEDFCKNFDALAGSQFFFKDSDAVDGKIYAGPCWDYDLCMGNINLQGIGSGLNPQGSWAVRVRNGRINWYGMLYKHQDFQAEVRRMYHERFRPALAKLIGEAGTDGEAIRSLERYADEIAASAEMNFIRFRPGNVQGIYEKSGKNHEDAKKYLFRWIRRRAASMDEEYGYTVSR